MNRPILLATCEEWSELHPDDRGIVDVLAQRGITALPAVVDMDEDGFPSAGDITHPLREIVVEPESKLTVEIEDLNVRN